MKRAIHFISIFLLTVVSLFCQSYTVEQITAFPYPSEMVSATSGNRLAWAMNEKGLRNIYVMQVPESEPRRITSFDRDDGQEITSLQFTLDGQWLVFVRGGEHGSNWDRYTGFNPSQEVLIPKVEIWKASFDGSHSESLTEGDFPTISPDGNTLAFIKNRQIWTIPMAGGKSTQLFEIKGNISSLEWLPDGERILFTISRGTHSFIGIYDVVNPSIRYIAPSFHRDSNPKCSPDGKTIAFIRRPGGTGEAWPLLEQRHNPWEIWVADIASGEGKSYWKAPETLRGSVPTTHGGTNLNWVTNETLIYLSYEDGWPHIYALDLKTAHSRQLTKGNFMVEHISKSHDGTFLVFSANTGPDKEDIDRRHIGMVRTDNGQMRLLTQGQGIEAVPVVLSDNQHIGFVSSTPQRPLLPSVLQIKNGEILWVGNEFLPSDFPMEHMVIPQQVTFQSPDGFRVHGQLFEKTRGAAKKPAVLFVHGGPQRQMLLGWHYGDYYSNTYAVNQYLAELGFVVLSVNFRLGIGYGYEFHRPPRTYWQGAEEYLDVKAAGEFLAGLPQVDNTRIGVYGGSYGGYLTALALGKDSELFSAGVDIHGVHDLSSRLEEPKGYEKAPDFAEALKTAWYSSPLAYLDTWTSPVLFIHGDDDRNVDVKHTTDLIRRFDERKMPYEYLIIPDDSHHWMKFTNLVKVNEATVAFLKKKLVSD
ncbi:MAG TPA: prolyl oligopeptidase family serine peptidase [Saprospiraceae bacterium]|nr:prolyl oligopeptidase family serine peptidase [Saprospiraceae bacterium]